MIRIDAVIARLPQLDEPRIADWVARGWVVIEGESGADWMFAEADIARLQLLRDLQVDMGLEEDSLPLVLSLLDQVHGLRRTLLTVLDVVNEAPDDLRDRVIAALMPRQ